MINYLCAVLFALGATLALFMIAGLIIWLAMKASEE